MNRNNKAQNMILLLYNDDSSSWLPRFSLNWEAV